jgi:hypothetical protein
MIFYLLVWFPHPLPGSENNPRGTGKCKGFIYKRDGRTPLWGAQILMKNVRSGKIFESNVTDGIGNYKLEDIPEGNYMVKILVKNKNYKVKKVDFLIKIFTGKTTTISFALKKFRKFPLILGLRCCKLFAFVAGAVAIGLAVFWSCL